MNSDDGCFCSTMVGVNVLHGAVRYTMVDMNTRAGRKSAWRCHGCSSETTHDVADVAAPDFDQLEGRGDRRDIATRLQNTDIRRRQTDALGQLLACQAALLVNAAPTPDSRLPTSANQYSRYFARRAANAASSSCHIAMISDSGLPARIASSVAGSRNRLASLSSAKSFG